MSLLTVQTPAKSQILVKVGQEVKLGDPLVEEERSKLVSLDIAHLLKVKPSKVKKLLVKPVGSRIEQGEPIAQKTSLLSKSALKSPESGVILGLDEGNGILTIQTEAPAAFVRSKVSGHIIKIKDDSEIVIEYRGVEVPAKMGFGPQKEGELIVLKDHHQDQGLSLDLGGKIVCARNWNSGALSKAKALGVAAVLGQEIDDDDFYRMSQKEGSSVFGVKDDFTLLIFEPEDFKTMIKYDNHQCIAWGEGKSLLITRR